MKKVLPILLVFGIAVIAAVLYFMLRNVESKLVQLTNLKTIKSIEIKNNDSIYFITYDHYWQANQQRIIAGKIETMLGALSVIGTYTPVSIGKTESYADSIDSKGITIKVKNRRGGHYSRAFVNIQGKNVMQYNSDKSLEIVEVKGGKDINIVSYLDINSSWFHNYLFEIPAENIQSLSLKYPGDSTKGFSIVKMNDYKLLNQHNELLKNANREDVKHYLHFYTKVHYDISNSADNKLNEYFHLKLNYTYDSTKVIAYLPPEESPLFNKQFLALIDDEKWILLNHLDFDPLLVTANYFLKKTQE